MTPQKYWNKLYQIATAAVFVLVVAGIGFAFFPKVAQFRDYQATRAAQEEEIRKDEEQIKDLRHKQERFQTDKYFVQKIAHEIGFAHDGETIYQFNEETGSNRPSATETTP